MEDVEQMEETKKVDFKQKCACKGSNLDHFIQPIILLILSHQRCTGYSVIKQMSAYAMFKGGKPDATGVYRYLKLMEGRGLICSDIILEEGKGQKKYSITETGQECLSHWKRTLIEYKNAINELIAEMDGIV